MLMFHLIGTGMMLQLSKPLKQPHTNKNFSPKRGRPIQWKTASDID